MYKPDDSAKGDAAENRGNSQEYDSVDILLSAELLFSTGYKKEAVSMAVRALRKKISAEHFGGRETSDRECRKYLLENANKHNNKQTIRILTSTEEQRFSEEDITETEFISLIADIRSVIDG